MSALSIVLALFVLFYLLPGSIFLSNAIGNKGKRLENVGLAVLLSVVLAPLTLTLFSRAFPGNDGRLFAGYVAFWALALLAVILNRRGVQRLMPDFSALPNADWKAWLLSALLAAAVVSLRASILRGYESLIGDDHFHLSKLTSIAATGLPSLYARQPLYAFTYYDLDYIVPAFWVRYSGGAIGIAQAWVVHIGLQTFVITLFLTRLLYAYVHTRYARLFGLLALHMGAGLDIFFLPLIEGQTHLDTWPLDLKWFDGFVQIPMPFNTYLWAPQHVLGVAVLGLIVYLTITRPLKGIPQVIALSLLMVALFKTSTFVFAGSLPGIALWHLYELLTGKGRLRRLLYLSASALIAGVLVFPSLIELFSKKSYLQFGLRSVEFLEIPWLKFPLSGFSYLFLEVGILLPLLLWSLVRYHSMPRPHRFWLCLTLSLLFPFVVRSPMFNDIALRGVMPAQFAAAIVGCLVLTEWEHRWPRWVAALFAIQVALTVIAVGTELFYRFTTIEPIAIPLTSRWIARNVPPNALVFYEQDYAQLDDRTLLTEVTHGQRMSYMRDPTLHDFIYTPNPPSSWRCLPDVNLYDPESLCSIEAYVPGVQPIFVKYLSSEPALDAAAFVPVHETANGSVFSLSCPYRDPPESSDPPAWMTDCTVSPWTLSGKLEPLTVHYDVGITIQEIFAHPAGGGGVVLKWLTAFQNESVLALSFRLYSAEDEKVHQHDTILWNQFTGNTSSRGHPELFSSLILFDYENAAQFLQYNQTIPMDFPDELPAGEYELRLTVYNAITLQETVELGTWKPEIVLSRLRYAPDNFE